MIGNIGFGGSSPNSTGTNTQMAPTPAGSMFQLPRRPIGSPVPTAGAAPMPNRRPVGAPVSGPVNAPMPNPRPIGSPVPQPMMGVGQGTPASGGFGQFSPPNAQVTQALRSLPPQTLQALHSSGLIHPQLMQHVAGQTSAQQPGTPWSPMPSAQPTQPMIGTSQQGQLLQGRPGVPPPVGSL